MSENVLKLLVLLGDPVWSRIPPRPRVAVPRASSLRRRVMLKAARMLIGLGCYSLLAYQAVITNNFEETRLVPEPETRLTIDSNKSSDHTNITIDDVFIAVKTSKHFVNTRIPLILKTWYRLAENQTWFFTDTFNMKLTLKTKGHVINTNCSHSHSRDDLCCKTSAEFDYYLNSGKNWFCHFDDDNYVNVPCLVTTLQRYNHLRDWYLGKTSVKFITYTENLETFITNDSSFQDANHTKASITFRFGTGGAGYCISRSLALKMTPIAGGGKFRSFCVHLNDDVTMGFIIEHMLQTNLTEIQEFHSHYEKLTLLSSQHLKNQVSLSYKEKNVVSVPGFDEKCDPTRLLSLHCFLFPNVEFCPLRFEDNNNNMWSTDLY